MRKQVFAIAAASILLPAIALANDNAPQVAQFNYEGPVDTMTLADLKNIKFGDENVVVEGRLIKQLANGDYLLSDGKNEVIAELDDDIKLNQAFNDKTLLRLSGEYEGREQVLEVERIQVVSQ